jgi:hypothetical protein
MLAESFSCNKSLREMQSCKHGNFLEDFMELNSKKKID